MKAFLCYLTLSFYVNHFINNHHQIKLTDQYLDNLPSILATKKRFFDKRKAI